MTSWASIIFYQDWRGVRYISERYSQKIKVYSIQWKLQKVIETSDM